MLTNVIERTPPCSTPVLIHEGVQLYGIHVCCPFMWLGMNLIMMFECLLV